MTGSHEQLITISTKTLLKVVLFGLLLWFVWFIRDILFLFFLSLLFAVLIEPFAEWLAKRNIPRGIAVFIVVGVLFGLLAALFSVLLPVVLVQSEGLLSNFGALWERVVNASDLVREFAARAGILESVTQTAHSLEPNLAGAARGLFSTVSGLFNSVFSTVLVIVLTYYMVVQEDVMKSFFQSCAPDHYRPFISQLVTRIEEKLGYWLRGQLMLSILIGVLVYVGLLILGVPYALLLGVLAGMMEVVPYVGPVLAAIPAVFVAFAQNPEQPVHAVLVLLLFVIIQQVENHLLVPKVMQKAVGINPIVSIISILVGVKLAGIIGGLLAIPVATIVLVFVQSLDAERKPKRRSRKS